MRIRGDFLLRSCVDLGRCSADWQVWRDLMKDVASVLELLSGMPLAAMFGMPGEGAMRDVGCR